MKFSWKIFFSTLTSTLILFSIGGYLLISALFRSAWQRELLTAGEENQMLCYSFVAYWNITDLGTDFSDQRNLQRAAQSMAGSMGGEKIRVRIRNSREETVYDSTGTPADGGDRRLAGTDRRALRLLETEGGYELWTTGMIQLGEEEALFLESVRDVTPLFAEREAHYGIYKRWMAWLLAVQGILCFCLANWLIRPLRRLSRATRRIAGGNLSVRANVESRDEIGELAADFNHMADHLERQFRELEDAARRQEDFIGSFAHELKTPLTSMIGYADMLRTQEMSPEERFSAANYIFKEGKRLEALSLKLLELMVVKNGELEKKRVNIQWLAEDIRGMLQPALRKAGITLKVVVENEALEIEPDLIKTVLLNLLDNGRKAMEGEKGSLYLLGRKEEDGFALYVRDTGKGIPKEELSRITEAFYMVDKSRARRQGGAGLGLSICAEIVRQHGGRMTFRSAEGKGTMVRIFLPAGGVE